MLDSYPCPSDPTADVPPDVPLGVPPDMPITLPAWPVDADVVLRTIAEGTAAAVGDGFFRALVESLATALGTFGAWVTEYHPGARRLRSLACIIGGQWVDDFDCPIDGTPCEGAVYSGRLFQITRGLVDRYPHSDVARELGLVSYLGQPLMDADGNVLGCLTTVDRRPLPPDPRLLAVFRIFAARAAAEYQRMAAEARVREREQKLSRLIDGAMDAILELDAGRGPDGLGSDGLRITAANAAAERVFRAASAGGLAGRPLADLLTPAGRQAVDSAVGRLGDGPVGAAWVHGASGTTFDARRADGQPFAAEATVSRYDHGGRACHTLILRDVGERLSAERAIVAARQAIQSLTAEAEYLRDEIRSLRGSERILGASTPMRQVLRDVEQVAPTDATVLILGETGTGKELVARALHERSRRRDKPLIKVNCAAVPAALMESEFFGHEKGAFTGATQRRDGRFALADGGTLFLDEVGELPVDLQVKLLRALQEGEFEPVGSGRTVKVDVRVVAATNRDLRRAVLDGTFREDLYYRLCVFPIRLPPLRDRGEDVIELARTFAAEAARRTGRPVDGMANLSPACARRLLTYSWPGNVRELQNVIERAVITSDDGRLNLARALPETDAVDPEACGRPRPASQLGGRLSEPVAAIRTAAELEAMDRENIRRALETTNWRIAGAGGACDLLGLKPSTLRSRMKSLGIRRESR